MRSSLGCSARPMRRRMCLDGAARTPAHEMWCATDTGVMTSTVPMRQRTCFYGPSRASTHELWYSTGTITCFVLCAWVAIRQPQLRLYDESLADRVGYYDYLCKLSDQSLGILLWVYSQHFLPTRLRRQPLDEEGSITFMPWFVPLEGPTGAASRGCEPRQETSSACRLQRCSLPCMSMSERG